MISHLAVGRNGEEIARSWLLSNGYQVLHNNWRNGRKEIDLIAVKSGILHFIEVKTRRGNDFGFPEEQVTRKKIRNLQAAATAYLEENPQWRKIQFDILSIELRPAGNAIYFIEDIS